MLCFPGIFRGALDVRAPAITEAMKMAAAHAIAGIVEDSELREDYIIPSVFNRDVAPAVAAAVAEEARAAGTALAGHEWASPTARRSPAARQSARRATGACEELTGGTCARVTVTGSDGADRQDADRAR